MSKDAKLAAAAELADHYIEIILSEEPGLLVEKIADQSSKDIAKSAKAIAEFRQHLTKALADQPIPEFVDEAHSAFAEKDDADKKDEPVDD